jgi:hypothetical protein
LLFFSQKKRPQAANCTLQNPAHTCACLGLQKQNASHPYFLFFFSHAPPIFLFFFLFFFFFFSLFLSFLAAKLKQNGKKTQPFFFFFVFFFFWIAAASLQPHPPSPRPFHPGFPAASGTSKTIEFFPALWRRKRERERDFGREGGEGEGML